MDGIYIVSFTQWKRIGTGFRPRMMDCGIVGWFTSEESAKEFLLKKWPELVYRPDLDDYRFDLDETYYAVYTIRWYKAIKET